MDDLRLSDDDTPSEQDETDLVDGEVEAFGPIGHSLEWRAKDRFVTLRTGDGRLVAAAGALIAPVRVGQANFDVIGIGGVMVTRTFRGRGLLPRLMEAILHAAATMGPERAILFCRPELVAVYERFGFIAIAAPIWVDQPSGHIEMPEPGMWRPLRDDAQWPPGRVDVPGLPF